MNNDTTIYGYSFEIHQSAERIIEHKIFTWQTSLVSVALAEELFSYDDITNLYDSDGEYQEIMQWITVSEWLADKLREAHEPILKNEYGTWWGRTCCGQSIILDGTIQEIVLSRL